MHYSINEVVNAEFCVTSDLGSDELYSLAHNIPRLISAAKVLNELGYRDFAIELAHVARDLMSRFITILSTPFYKDGIAFELSNSVKSLWECKVNEANLTVLLNELIEYKNELIKGKLTPEDSKALVKDLIDVIEVTLSKSPTLAKFINVGGKPAEVFQTILVGLLVSVGGVGGDINLE